MTKRKPVEKLVLSAAQQRAWLALADLPVQDLQRRPGAALASALAITAPAASALIAGLVASGAAARVGARGLDILRPSRMCAVHCHPASEFCPGEIREVSYPRQPYLRVASIWNRGVSKTTFLPTCILLSQKEGKDGGVGVEPHTSLAPTGPLGLPVSGSVSMVFALDVPRRTNFARQLRLDVDYLVSLYVARRRLEQPEYVPRAARIIDDMIKLVNNLREFRVDRTSWGLYMAFVFDHNLVHTAGRTDYPPTWTVAAGSMVDRFVCAQGFRMVDRDHFGRMLRGAGFVDVDVDEVERRYNLLRTRLDGDEPGPAPTERVAVAVQWLREHRDRIRYADKAVPFVPRSTRRRWRRPTC